MRQHVAFISVLHTNMVESASISHVNFQNNMRARAILPGLNQGYRCSLSYFDHMVTNRITMA